LLEGLGDISRCHSRDQLLGWRQCIQGKGSTLVVAHLAFGEQQHDGPDLAVAYGMQHSEGADCSLEHVGIFRAGCDVAVLAATRIFDAAYFIQANAGPMAIQAYQLESDGNAGRSPIVLKAQGRLARTQPLCAGEDVETAIKSAASGWRRVAVEP